MIAITQSSTRFFLGWMTVLSISQLRFTMNCRAFWNLHLIDSKIIFCLWICSPITKRPPTQMSPFVWKDLSSQVRIRWYDPWKSWKLFKLYYIFYAHDFTCLQKMEEVLIFTIPFHRSVSNKNIRSFKIKSSHWSGYKNKY